MALMISSSQDRFDIGALFELRANNYAELRIREELLIMA